MSLILWLPFDGHPYQSLFAEEARQYEQLEDGYSRISAWIGEDGYEKTVTGHPRRKYWLQLFARGVNDRKALLWCFGIPAPPIVTEEHVEDAVSYLGWPDFTWEPIIRGSAWIFPKIE